MYKEVVSRDCSTAVLCKLDHLSSAVELAITVCMHVGCLPLFG